MLDHVEGPVKNARHREELRTQRIEYAATWRSRRFRQRRRRLLRPDGPRNDGELVMDTIKKT